MQVRKWCLVYPPAPVRACEALMDLWTAASSNLAMRETVHDVIRTSTAETRDEFTSSTRGRRTQRQQHSLPVQGAKCIVPVLLI